MSGGKKLMASDIGDIQKYEGNLLINNDFLIVRLRGNDVKEPAEEEW